VAGFQSRLIVNHPEEIRRSNETFRAVQSRSVASDPGRSTSALTSSLVEPWIDGVDIPRTTNRCARKGLPAPHFT